MTQIDVASTAQPTPFAELLQNTAIHHPLGIFRGVLTPSQLDAPVVESEALALGAAVHDLGWLKRVAVRGEDRFRWLSGMVTNTVNDLADHSGAWNLVLNAQGRIQGDLTVWREDDQLELEIAADEVDRLLAHFDRFIIMDDVELVSLDGTATIGLTGPLTDQVLERVGLPVLAEPMTSTRVGWNGMDLHMAREFGAISAHYVLAVPETQLSKLMMFLRTGGAVAVGSDAVEAFRIAEGIPLYGVDMVERDLPQETSQTRALHFSKGCYLGQEIVERIRSRGNVHRHLRQLELFGPVPPAGIALTSQSGAEAGHLTSVANIRVGSSTRTFALAMIRGEFEAGHETLEYAFGESKASAVLLAVPPAFSPTQR